MFSNDIGNVIFKYIFQEKVNFCFFWQEDNIILYRKKKYHIFRAFAKHTTRSCFREKKYHLSWWYKKDHIPVRFFGSTIFAKHLKKIYGFSCSVGQICAILTMTGNTWLKLVVIVRNKKFMMLGSLYTKHDFVRSIMFS